MRRFWSRGDTTVYIPTVDTVTTTTEGTRSCWSQQGEAACSVSGRVMRLCARGRLCSAGATKRSGWKHSCLTPGGRAMARFHRPISWHPEREGNMPRSTHFSCLFIHKILFFFFPPTHKGQSTSCEMPRSVRQQMGIGWEWSGDHARSQNTCCCLEGGEITCRASVKGQEDRRSPKWGEHLQKRMRRILGQRSLFV